MAPTFRKSRHLGVSCCYPRQHVFAQCRQHVGRGHVGPDISCLPFRTLGRHADIQHSQLRYYGLDSCVSEVLWMKLQESVGVTEYLACHIAWRGILDLGWKCRRRVGVFFFQKTATCRHVGAMSPTRHRPCRRHRAMSALQMRRHCRVGVA